MIKCRYFNTVICKVADFSGRPRRTSLRRIQTDVEMQENPHNIRQLPGIGMGAQLRTTYINRNSASDIRSIKRGA